MGKYLNKAIKNISNSDAELKYAFKNVNGTIIPLSKIVIQKNGKKEEIRFTWSQEMEDKKNTLQALYDSLRPITFTPADLLAFAGSATYTGVNGLGTMMFPNRQGVNINIPVNGFLSDGDKVHITLTPKVGYKLDGPREFDIDIPANSFSNPTHTFAMTPAVWQDIKDKLTYTGSEGKGVALGQAGVDYNIIIEPDGTLTSGDTIKLTAIPKGQVLLTGPKEQIIKIPDNSFTNIVDTTWADLVAKFEPTLTYGNYEGTGTVDLVSTIPGGAAVFSPNTGLSNGDTVSVQVALNDGYTIDGHSNTEGLYTGTFVIPDNTFAFDPATVIGDNVPRDSIIPNLHFTGYQGAGEITDGVYKEFSHTFTPATGLSNGDVITVDVAANSGYHYSGPTSFTYTIPTGTLPDKPATPVAATDTIFPIPNRLNYGNPDGGVSARANSNWIRGGFTYSRDDVQTSDPLDPKHLVVYDGVKHVDSQAFVRAEFTSIDLPDGLLDIGEDAFNDSKLTSLVIPNSVTTIGDGAFGQSKLTSLVIPNSVTSIGRGAFSQSKLTSLVIPNSVTSIGVGTFNGIVNTPTTTVSMPSKFNTDAEKDRIFGNGAVGQGSGWDQITFIWT